MQTDNGVNNLWNAAGQPVQRLGQPCALAATVGHRRKVVQSLHMLSAPTVRACPQRIGEPKSLNRQQLRMLSPAQSMPINF
jgi:hypothetical protein